MTGPPAAAPTRPVVAIWRSSWLPPSETFVENQAAGLRRWQPVRVGLRQLPVSLPVTPDLAPFSRSLISRVGHRLSAAAGYRWPYDRWLRRRDVRLIHAHFGPGGVKALPIARRTGIPLIVTFHGFDVTTAARAEGADGDRYRRELRGLFAGAARLIAVSDFVAGELRDLGAPPERVVVHTIGIPLEGVAAQPDPGPGKMPDLDPDVTPDRSDDLVVTFVGRLIPRKGVDQLIEAASLLPPTLRDRTRVRIVGFGPHEQQLRELAASTEVAIEFLGRRTPAEVAQALAGSTVFCAPSRSIGYEAEGFGLVFLEAALAGVPAVAYRHAGVTEAVQDGVTGLLAPEGDVAALSRHLATLLGDPVAAARMGAAGAARVRRQFDIVARTVVLEDLYDEVVAERR